jgi:carbamoyltransferase
LNDKIDYKNSEIMYLGFDYDYQPPSKYTAVDLDLDVIANSVADGKIICWFQGRSEFGPRALGNRSFITDPRRKEMKDILNSRVKFREWYRPFAPVVLNEYKEEWFQMDFESPFMLFTVPCKKPQEIPSAVHIDNTGRVQTLRREDNEKFYDLIDKFRQITGVPIVMNTSLNIKGEPIVETPEDAMKLFEESDVDVLVINNKMYFK